MIEQSTENSFSQDNSLTTEQVRRQNGNELHHNSDLDELFHVVTQLAKRIKELDKKSTRIEELISSIRKDIKSAVMTLETNYQITSDSSTKFTEFHEEIARLQTQIQKIEQAFSDVFKSKKTKKTKKTKKPGKDKKMNKKDKKLSNEGQDEEKKKKMKKMKKKQK